MLRVFQSFLGLIFASLVFIPAYAQDAPESVSDPSRVYLVGQLGGMHFVARMGVGYTLTDYMSVESGVSIRATIANTYIQPDAMVFVNTPTYQSMFLSAGAGVAGSDIIPKAEIRLGAYLTDHTTLFVSYKRYWERGSDFNQNEYPSQFNLGLAYHY